MLLDTTNNQARRKKQQAEVKLGLQGKENNEQREVQNKVNKEGRDFLCSSYQGHSFSQSLFHLRNMQAPSMCKLVSLDTELPSKPKNIFFQKLPVLTVEQQSFNKIGYCITASKADSVILINSSDAISPRSTVNYYRSLFISPKSQYHNTSSKDVKCAMVYLPMAPSILVSPESTDLI